METLEHRCYPVGFAASPCYWTGDRLSWVSIPAYPHSALAVRGQCNNFPYDPFSPCYVVKSHFPPPLFPISPPFPPIHPNFLPFPRWNPISPSPFPPISPIFPLGCDVPGDIPGFSDVGGCLVVGRSALQRKKKLAKLMSAGANGPSSPELETNRFRECGSNGCRLRDTSFCTVSTTLALSAVVHLDATLLPLGPEMEARAVFSFPPLEPKDLQTLTPPFSPLSPNSPHFSSSPIFSPGTSRNITCHTIIYQAGHVSALQMMQE